MRAAVLLLAVPLAAGCGAPSQEKGNRQQTNDVAASAAPVPTVVPRPPATPHTSPWSKSGYALNGTEPFWGGSLTGTSVRYMTPDDQFGDVIETRVSYAPDRETYTGAWRGGPFLLTLRRGPCSDGMSDRTYAFSVELRVAGESRRGCADPQ